MTALPVAVLAPLSAALLSLAMALAWLVAMRTGRSGMIDAIWSLATGAVAALAALLGGGASARGITVAALMAFWGGRLALHLWRRAGHGDDPRYAALKREWGDAAPTRLFRFVQIQALASCPLVAAAGLAGGADGAPGGRDAAGLAIIVVALAGEAVADAQMARFKVDPANRGQLCDAGLWGWSRHPNYFCEWLLWLGIAVIAAGGWGWLALLAPATMYGLLVHVSGIPPLEAHLAQTRPAALARYQQRVGAFWPRPPRRSGEA